MHAPTQARRPLAGDGAASRTFGPRAPETTEAPVASALAFVTQSLVGGTMRRSKADVERYIASVQGSAPSPREVSGPGPRPPGGPAAAAPWLPLRRGRPVAGGGRGGGWRALALSVSRLPVSFPAVRSRRSGGLASMPRRSRPAVSHSPLWKLLSGHFVFQRSPGGSEFPSGPCFWG